MPMPVFICNILQGASIIERFQVCLVVSQALGEGTLVQILCWYARRKWASQFSLVACEYCLEVCFMGLMVGTNYVWRLAIVVIFMGFGQAGARRCVRCLKVIIWGVAIQVTQKGALFIGKTGSHYVILLYCETLLQVLPGIYCKTFYWIPLFTMLLLFYVFEVSKTKSTTQSVLMILTLNGLFQKKFQVFTLPLEIPDKTRLHPQKLHIIVLHPS